MKGFQITEEEHVKFFQQALNELKTISENSALSAIADSMAVNRQLAQALVESRQLVEGEAVQIIDAMCLAFDDKASKLKNLKALTETVSAESAFMKTALNTIETKTAEITRLTGAIDGLSDSLARFKSLVDDGTLDRAASAANAIA